MAEFEKLIRTPTTPVSALQQAVALVHGDFLDGFYDDWVLGERYRLESLYCDALAGLMAAWEALGEHAVALAAALRLLEQDPLALHQAILEGRLASAPGSTVAPASAARCAGSRRGIPWMSRGRSRWWAGTGAGVPGRRLAGGPLRRLPPAAGQR